MPPTPLPKIGIIFAQFAAYHIDRCEAVAKRLEGRFHVRAVEVATTSTTYAWESSGPVAGAEKLTLFPERSFDSIGRIERLFAEYRALRGCRFVLVGLSYAETDVIMLTWLLRLSGVRLVVLSESKFDDSPRRWMREAAKALMLSVYSAAIVGGRRHLRYLRFLGFFRRPVLPGYDTVGLSRIRQEALGADSASLWSERPFVFVGRFVKKKNLAVLLRAYADYVFNCNGQPRSLLLIGDGELRPELMALATKLGVTGTIEWTGFLAAKEISKRLAGALALCLVSEEEQWGLVVNEALAMNLPVIVSDAVGARDALVRNGLNGYVVDGHDENQISWAMSCLAGDQGLWERMTVHSSKLAWLGDQDRFADAVELICGTKSVDANQRIAAFCHEMGI